MNPSTPDPERRSRMNRTKIGQNPGVTVPSPETGMRIVGKPVAFPGYVHGLRQPAMMFKVIPGPAITQDQLNLLDRIIEEKFSGPRHETGTRGHDSRIRFLVNWTQLILEKNGHPVFEEARIRPPTNPMQPVWTILQPCLDFHACMRVVGLCVDLLQGMNKIPATSHAASQLLNDALAKTGNALKRGRLRGFNTLHFLKAAHELDIPWQRLSENVFQIGIGAPSRLLDSSLTDRTPSISAMLARNKVQAAALLRNAGLPVPPHSMAGSAEQAIAAAEKLAYPVVVKPADQDGGVGVSAFLHDAKAVRQGFERASRHSKQILIEKHVPGKDYRFQIVNGVVHGVLERSPGGVVGDGQLSVRQLVERQNRERETATDDRRYLHTIVLDEEAEAILATANMNWDSVPAANVFVRLRGASNVASGGIPQPIPVDEVHPDNLALAVRASRILRLDVAGIDLLIPDIRQSWISSGAAICEVNAQPQMFTTLHVPMLQSLMGGTDGRVPVIIVLSSSPAERFSTLLHERLCTRYPATGLVNAECVRLGASRIFASHPGMFVATRALLIDRALEALVFTVSDRHMLKHGWPVDRCDAVLLAGGNPLPEAPLPDTEFLALCDSVRTLLPRKIFVDGSDPVCLDCARRIEWSTCQPIEMTGEHEQICHQVADALLDWLTHSR